MKPSTSFLLLFFIVTAFSPVFSQFGCNGCTSNTCTYSFDSRFFQIGSLTTVSIVFEEGDTCTYSESDFPLQFTIPEGEDNYTVTVNADVPDNSTQITLSEDRNCVYSANGDDFLGGIGTIDIRIGGDEEDDPLEEFSYYWWQLNSSTDSDESFFLSLDNEENMLVSWEDDANVTTGECLDFPFLCGCDLSISQVSELCSNGNCPGTAINLDAQLQVPPLFTGITKTNYLAMIQELRRRPPTSHLLDDAMGEIEDIFLMDIVSGGSGVEEVENRYRGIIDAFSEAVYYYNLINLNASGLSKSKRIQSREKVEKSLLRIAERTSFISPIEYCYQLGLENAAAGNDCHECDSYQANIPSQWAQDPFIVLENQAREPVLMSCLSFDDFTDYYSALELSATSGILTKQVPFAINGGNLQNSGGLLLVGADALADAIQTLFGQVDTIYVSEMRKLMELTFPEEQIVFVGDTLFRNSSFSNSMYLTGTYQPVYHLDFFLNPGGIIEEDGEQKLLWFVGDVMIYNPLELPYDTVEVAAIKGEIDRIAENLGGLKIGGRSVKVVRIPLPMTFTDTEGYLPVAYLSLNNCIVERLNLQEGNIYLPDYFGTLPETFWKRAAKIFEEEGFKVIRVNGYFTLSAITEASSLHCATKILKRKFSYPVSIQD